MCVWPPAGWIVAVDAHCWKCLHTRNLNPHKHSTPVIIAGYLPQHFTAIKQDLQHRFLMKHRCSLPWSRTGQKKASQVPPSSIVLEKSHTSTADICQTTTKAECTHSPLYKMTGFWMKMWGKPCPWMGEAERKCCFPCQNHRRESVNQIPPKPTREKIPAAANKGHSLKTWFYLSSR